MQQIKNTTIEIIGNKIQFGDWNYLLLQNGDVKIWHVKDKDKDGQCTYQDSLESAVFHTKSLGYKSDDLGG